VFVASALYDDLTMQQLTVVRRYFLFPQLSLQSPCSFNLFNVISDGIYRIDVTRKPELILDSQPAGNMVINLSIVYHYFCSG